MPRSGTPTRGRKRAPRRELILDALESALRDTRLTDLSVEQIAREGGIAGIARDDPLLSPLTASDVGGLPPALIVTAELDPLRDDGIRYAQRLQDAGVAVETLELEGLIHHALLVPQAISRARAALDDLATAMVAHHTRAG